MLDLLKYSTIYEVNIRQYTKEGTFNAFAKHLPRLHKMGIKIIWLMPITPIGKVNRLNTLGSYYACSSYTEINEEFGNLDDFKHLVSQIHALDMHIIIDWVANHTAFDHNWALLNPAWYEHNENGDFVEKNGWTDVIDLDYTNQDMQQEMILSMKYWINETNIDGFRCDMAHLVPLSFWQKAKQACDSLKQHIWLGEFENTEYHQVFQVSYAWWWMHETERYQKKETDLQQIIQVLHQYSQYPAKSLKLFYTSNHDENSWNGTESEKYKQNALLWAVFSFTWINGIPLIYSGQEIPNEKRLLFFDKDCINWDKLLLNEKFYTKLISLKLHNKALHNGEIHILPTNQSDVFAYILKKDHHVVLVILNLGDNDRIKLPVNHPWLQGNFINLANELAFNFNNNTYFELSAHSYIVYYR